jgi:hypothetical protein
LNEGSFEATGLEHRNFGDPAVFLPTIGMLQVLVALAILASHVVPGTYAEVLVISFFISIGIMILSGAVNLVVRATSPPAGKYLVHFVDERRSGSNLTISYENTRGKSRVRLIVKNVKAYHHPLFKPGVRFIRLVTGTKCYVDVIFENSNLGLALGFPSEEEMNKVYEQIK